MKVFASGLAAAVLWLCAGSADAASAPVAAAPTAQQDQSAEAEAVQAWLAATGQWTQGYDTLTSQMIETLTWLVDGSSTLAVKLQSGGPAVARPWAERWAEEARARLAADMDAYTALSTEAPPFPRNVPMTPLLRTRIEVIGQTSDQVGRMVLVLRQSSDNYIAVMLTAAAGKEGDLRALESARMGLMISQLEAEITMVESSARGLAGPNLHLARTQIASNRALMIWLEHNRLLFTDEPTNGPVAAAGIRVQAVEVRDEVAAMRGAIAEMRQRFRAEPGFTSTPLGFLLTQVLVTLEQSAEVEERMAGAMDALADAVASGDEAADDAVGPTIESLTNERLAIDAARRQLIAQNAG